MKADLQPCLCSVPVVLASLEARSTYDQVLAALPDTALPA